jgi:hypothetical protein
MILKISISDLEDIRKSDTRSTLARTLGYGWDLDEGQQSSSQ